MQEKKEECLEAAKEKNQIKDSRYPLLLIDKTIIKEKEKISLTVCEAVKHSENPVLALGKPGSVDEGGCRFDGSVYYKNGKFCMWYFAEPGDCTYAEEGACAYAESDDGIHWTKPDLGLVDFRGNKKNNLVPMPGRAMFFDDVNEPDPKKRYKKPIGKGHPERGIAESLWSFAYSADGFNWEVEDRPLPEVYRQSESQTLAKVGKTWVIQTQTYKSGIGRTANVYYSDDLNKNLLEWEEKEAWEFPEGGKMYFQPHHGIKSWTRPGLCIGLYGIFCNRFELPDTTCELGLLLSNDGYNFWEPWPLATIIRRGPAGSWDSMFLMHGAPSCINVEDKTYIYYSGCPSGNDGDFMQIGLATLRRDGFGYVGIEVGWGYREKAVKTGTFITNPILLHDKAIEKVLLNVDNLNNKQWIKVEILDDKGQPIPGYTLKEADKITTNGIAVSASWEGNASLKDIPGNNISLRVYMQGGQARINSPRLYAIYFYEPKHIEQ